MGLRRPAVAALICVSLAACASPPDGRFTSLSTVPSTTGAPLTDTSAPASGGPSTTGAPRPPLTTAVAGCAAGSVKGPLTVLAASSMVNVLTELRDSWLAGRPCVSSLDISYGSSAMLAAQITNGAPADVFISASDATMATVRNAGLASIAPRVFARNKAIILLNPDSAFAGVVKVLPDLLDSTNPGIKVGLCVATAPCGSLANTVLANGRTVYSRPDLTRNSVADTESPSVEDLVTKVEMGELDAGIVYVSDCSWAQPRGLAACAELPDAVNSSNNYLVAGLNTRADTAAFVDWVMSGAFGAVARTKYGFLSP